MIDKLTIPSKTLKQEADKLGAVLSSNQLRQISEFCSILAEFNQHTNLISNCEAPVLLRDHVLDSLSLARSIQQKKNGLIETKASLIDIGSGGGFPGLILAIAEPLLEVALVESVAKKARFLSEAITLLSLNDRVTVFNRRAELMAHDHNYRHQFSFVTSRALGSLSLVLELTLPFLRRGGVAVIQRSALQAAQEKIAAAKEVAIFRASLTEVIYPSEAVLGKKRAILLFEQQGLAPKIYPRPWPKPKEQPLF